MWQLLLFSLLLVPISTSTPTSLSERTLSDFGSLNLGLWTVDLNAVYDFFAAPAVHRNFFIVQTSKAIWSILGFFVGHAFWQGLRGNEKVSSDPDFQGLLDFVLSDDTAFMNVGINIGYMVFGNLAYQSLALLGEPARRKRRQDAEERGILFNTLKSPSSSLKTGGDAWLDNLDSFFGLDNVLVNSLVTIINTAAFLGFWFAMSYLPQRTSSRKRSQGKPSQGQPFFLGGRELPQLPHIGMESSDHWSEILTQS